MSLNNTNPLPERLKKNKKKKTHKHPYDITDPKETKQHSVHLVKFYCESVQYACIKLLQHINDRNIRLLECIQYSTYIKVSKIISYVQYYTAIAYSVCQGCVSQLV